jgi:hypothetical protein
METFWIILLAAPTLLIAVLAFLALIVTSIRRGDRRSLYDGPGGRADRITRRVLRVGVRNSSSDESGERHA